MNLDRVSKWAAVAGFALACALPALSFAVATGGDHARLAAVEKRVDMYALDHDRFIAMDANLKWIMRYMGGSPK